MGNVTKEYNMDSRGMRLPFYHTVVVEISLYLPFIWVIQNELFECHQLSSHLKRPIIQLRKMPKITWKQRCQLFWIHPILLFHKFTYVGVGELAISSTSTIFKDNNTGIRFIYRNDSKDSDKGWWEVDESSIETRFRRDVASRLSIHYG